MQETPDLAPISGNRFAYTEVLGVLRQKEPPPATPSKEEEEEEE